MNFITWSLLKKIQKIRLVKGMYIWIFIVPLFAKTFEKVSDLVTVTIFGYTFDLQFELPFSWQLFYFSAVLFVLGNLVYYVFCPRLVNEHESFSDFSGSGKNMQQLSGYITEMNFDQTELMAIVGLPADQPPSETEKEKGYQNMFWEVLKKADTINTRARVFVGAFYTLAILFIIIVFIQNTGLIFGSLI